MDVYPLASGINFCHLFIHILYILLEYHCEKCMQMQLRAKGPIIF